MLFLAAFLSSCANYELNYAGKSTGRADPLPADRQPVHSLYLIGDTGSEEDAPGLELLARHLREAGPNSSVLFLGDQLNPDGMPPEDREPERSRREAELRRQLDLVREFTGRIFFLPGHLDWAGYGVEGLEEQRDFIEKSLNQKNVWFPEPGCGDPVEIDLADDLVLIILDSQWWLTDWSGETRINAVCEAKSRDNFKLLFEDALKSNREKNVVVALHHPLFSNGPHGGAFTPRQHLFPFTELNSRLWLPLPGLGSLYPFYRASVGAEQDLANPNYVALRNSLLDVARRNGQFIFVSGHENSLQYVEKEGQLFVVSGAGAHSTAARTGGGVEFACGREGFGRLDFYADGATWLRFWTAEEEDGRLVFRKKIKDRPERHRSSPSNRSFPTYESSQADTTLAIQKEPERPGSLDRWLWGRHYRDAYAVPVNYPVLRLDTFQGGVLPIKTGGGYQTNSLRLENAAGREFTMRSVVKDATRSVPYPLNRSDFVLKMVADAFSASHPMSAMPIPPLADVAGVYHTHPRLYYIPRQPALGQYNESFGDGIYLVEERPDDKAWRDESSFGNPDEVVSTVDVVEKIIQHHDHRVDWRSVVRARAFDLLIGDWDRHDDQWRWARFDFQDSTLYRPIPRDRDQAFSQYDGFLYGIARRVSPAARPLRPYLADPPKIYWSNYGARHFDPTFLSGADWPLWEEEVKRLQERMTDQAIEEAFRRNWPASLYELDGPRVVSLAQERRDNLLKLARELYEFQAREVDVLGTDKKDLFLVERRPDGVVAVRVFDTNKKGEQEEEFYRRTFHPEETREIRLYGLADDDIFRISGETRRGPLLRIIGGLGEDSLNDESRVRGGARKTLYYDAEDEQVSLNTGPETRIRLSDDPTFNLYNRRARDYEFNYSTFLPFLASNPDDGLLVGANTSFTTYGFKKSPYASRHSVTGLLALETGGVVLTYRGEWVDAFPDGNFELDAIFQTPLYASNFYGLGNETTNPEASLGAEYNRYRQRYYRLRPSFVHRITNAAYFGFGPAIESYRIDLTGDRFIDEVEPYLDPRIFDGMEFVGVNVRLGVDNLNDPLFPTHGLRLETEAGWTMSLADADRNFPYLRGLAAIYQQLIPNGNLVLASRLGGEHILNNKFEFFQAATLGGQGPGSNLRGFRRDRFSGRSAFFHNIDLRWNWGDLDNRILPLSAGLFGGFDYGRVWLDGEDSNVWHYSFGGGFWLAPLDMVYIQFSLFRGDDGLNRFAFGGRFFF